MQASNSKILIKAIGLILLAPLGGVLSAYLLARFGAKSIGEWGRWPTFLGGFIAGLVFQIISKYRDICNLDGLSELQRDKLVAIVRQRTLRFWMVLYLLIIEFLTGFAIAPLADTELGYWVAAIWIAGFFYVLFSLVFIKGWHDEVEDFKLVVAQQAREETERGKLLDELLKGASEKVERNAELDAYNSPYVPKKSGKK